MSGVDVIARGLAARARAAAPRVPIAIEIVGQSNERGQVDPAETIAGVASATAWPQAYRSQRNPGLVYPIGPAVTKQGGMWFRLHDDLWDWGYEARLVNGAIGSMSMLADAGGKAFARTNATAYRQQRASGGPGDRGFQGDVIVAQGRVFLCTVGRLAYCMNAGFPLAGDASNVPELDYVRVTGTNATGGTEPVALATAAAGDTIADGTVQWTCVSATTTWRGYGYSSDGALTESRAGFDPYGILRRIHDQMQAIRDARHRIIVIQNAQSDTGLTSGQYTAALNNVATYFLNRGYIVMPGLSVFNPAATTTQYDNLSAGVANSLTQLRNFAGAAYTAAQVRDGANLYQLMGSSGAMGPGGAWFQKDAGQDNLHLNAAGAVAAGGHIANAIKGWLPPGGPLTRSGGFAPVSTRRREPAHLARGRSTNR